MSRSGPAGPELVRAEQVGVDLGGHRVLDGVDLLVRPGQLVAVTGPSGVGKTTLLRAVVGLVPLRRGTVRRTDRMAMVFQDPRLLPWRSVIDNITFGLGRPATAQERRRGEDLLSRLGLGGQGPARPGDLSGGCGDGWRWPERCWCSPACWWSTSPSPTWMMHWLTRWRPQWSPMWPMVEES